LKLGIGMYGANYTTSDGITFKLEKVELNFEKYFDLLAYVYDF
jgi:hypothetical protein